MPDKDQKDSRYRLYRLFAADAAGARYRKSWSLLSAVHRLKIDAKFQASP